MNKKIILGINAFDHGSTGESTRNMLEYLSDALGCDYQVIAYLGDGKPHSYQYSSPLPFVIRVLNRFSVPYRLKWPIGSYFRIYTRRVMRTIKDALKRYQTVIVNLNNMHDGKLNNKMLFRFLRKHKVRTIYTLHDCWPFTGGCYYYGNGEVHCDHWKSGCHNCPLKLPYTSRMIKAKTNDLLRMENIMLMPTSEWLAKEAKQSVLGKLPIHAAHSDTCLMPPAIPNPRYREKWGIPAENKVVISVGAYWCKWKGIDYIYEVADRLPHNYTFLIVGNIDPKGRKNIVVTGFVPAEELPYCYAAADCFISVTQCETLGLVIPEAERCGVPIVGFGHGGTVESVNEKTSIMVGIDNDVDKLVQAVVHVVEDRPFQKEDIVAAGMNFAKGEYGKRVLPFYKTMLGID
ncbi:MAG: glycosyltransferase [Bacilli bacterium]|nr:glycosyltransferase [Bacilli bacterium]